jgi:hypothetical protein
MIEREGVQMRCISFGKSSRCLQQSVSFRKAFGRRGYCAAAISLDHAQHAVHEIAELTGQLGFVGLTEARMREVSIPGRSNVAQQKIAQRVRP